MHCLTQGLVLCLLVRCVSQQQFDQTVEAGRERDLQRRLPKRAWDLKRSAGMDPGLNSVEAARRAQRQQRLGVVDGQLLSHYPSRLTNGSCRRISRLESDSGHTGFGLSCNTRVAHSFANIQRHKRYPRVSRNAKRTNERPLREIANGSVR